MDKTQYEVKPDGFWTVLIMMGYDGYDIMEKVGESKDPWKVIPAWGALGWDLGSWPLVAVYFKGLSIVLYVEGDITQYDCPDIETRNAIVDEIAFFHWKHADEPWVAGMESADQAPEYLRGPSRRTRSDEYKGHRLVSFHTGFLYEASVVFSVGNDYYIQRGPNVYRGTLRWNKSHLKTSQGFEPSEYIDVDDLNHFGPAC